MIAYANKSYESYVKDINPKSLILAKDYSEEELYNYIISVDQDDEKYCEIYNNPIVPTQENNYTAEKEKLGKKYYLY